MAIYVSSWFIDQLSAKTSEPKRSLTIAGSDYSERVIKWPRFKRTWDMVRPTDLAISLANEDQAMNFFVNTPTNLQADCLLKFGFTHPTSGDEFITMYQGTVQRAQYGRGACTLRLLDKMKAFTERTVGDKDAPAIFSGGLPSDIAWTLCTCYGGLSNIMSDSNPDIEWGTFQSWAAVFSEDTVLMDAQFEGMKVAEGLKRIAHMTDSAIFNEHGQVEFRRFSVIDSNTTFLGDDHILDLTLTVDDAEIVNRQIVYGDYDVTSDQYATEALSVSSSSVNSFGAREDLLKDNAMWYVGSASAQNMAQRRTLHLSEPINRYIVDTVIIPMNRSLGEAIRISDSFIGISSLGLRLMSSEVDMDKGLMRLEVDASRLLTPFILDDATYGLLDQDYNFLL